MIDSFLGTSPRLDATNFVAPNAIVIGDVTLGSDSSVWFGAVIRGDVNWIRIGDCSNVQDHAVVHVTHGTAPTRIGSYVSVAHRAVIHGCTIRDRVLLGIGCIVLDHAEVGPDCIVGAGAVVTPRTVIPPRSLVTGVPARVVRSLTDEEVESIRRNAENYVRYGRIYRGVEVPDGNPFYEGGPDEG
ncbi:MAG: gamma carbonic anhydrase family protein [Rhodothermales bacterium]|nr:gamma carbonic anhydrase family protein [Rhodothermales bacterium]